MGSSRKRSKAAISRKGLSGGESEKPGESEIQEGRGASVVSTITLVTALEARSKPLKAGAIELEQKTQARTSNDRRGNDRRDPERIRDEGQTPEGETLHAAAR